MADVPKAVSFVDGRAASFGVVHGRPLDAFLRLLFNECSRRTVAVDAACGRGTVTRLLAPRVKALTAVDVDEEAVRHAARAVGADRRRNVTFYQSDLEEEAWDAWLPGGVGVCSMHLFGSDRAFEQAGRALPTGCVLVASTFGVEQWRETGRRHRFAYEGDRLRAVVEGAGFRVTDLTGEAVLVNVPSFDVLESQYLADARSLVDRWKADGRWEALRDAFRRGERTLTESRLVVRAVRE